MPTPNFKLLANALRLGQPPEPTAAFRVLCEVIEQQGTEIAELRSRVGMLASRLQFVEAKLERMGTPRIGDPATIDDANTNADNRDLLSSTMSVPCADIDAIVAQAGGMPFKPSPDLAFDPPEPPPSGHPIDEASYDDSLMTNIMPHLRKKGSPRGNE